MTESTVCSVGGREKKYLEKAKKGLYTPSAEQTYHLDFTRGFFAPWIWKAAPKRPRVVVSGGENPPKCKTGAGDWTVVGASSKGRLTTSAPASPKTERKLAWNRDAKGFSTSLVSNILLQDDDLLVVGEDEDAPEADLVKKEKLATNGNRSVRTPRRKAPSAVTPTGSVVQRASWPEGQAEGKRSAVSNPSDTVQTSSSKPEQKRRISKGNHHQRQKTKVRVLALPKSFLSHSQQAMRRRQMRLFATRFKIQYVKRKLNNHFAKQQKQNTVNYVSSKCGKFIVDVKIQNVRLTAFLDTGANVSLLPRDLAKNSGINLENAKKGNSINLLSYSGHEISNNETRILSLQFGDAGFYAEHPFVITENSSNLVLIGADVLAKYKIPIFWSKGQAYISLVSSTSAGGGNETGKQGARDWVPVSFDLDEMVCENVNEIVIKPYRLKTVPIKIRKCTDFPDKLIVLPRDNCPHPITYTPALTHRCDCIEKDGKKEPCGAYLAQIYNSGNTEVKIPAGKLKGVCAHYDAKEYTTVKAADVLNVDKKGKLNGFSSLFHNFAGKNALVAEVHSLTREKERIGDFDIRPEDIDIFEESDPWGVIDEETGFPLEPKAFRTAADAIDLTSYDKLTAKYVEDIFINRYPETVARSFFDSGNASRRGLGKVRIVTNAQPKDGKRIYPLSKRHRLQLLQLLKGMTSVHWLKRCTASTGFPTFIIPRKDPSKPCRLLINLISQNKCCIQIPASLMSSPLLQIQKLSNASLFSSIDLSQGYFSLELEPNSKALTVLNTEFGQFQCNRLPQGGSYCPSLFQAQITRVINDDPITDSLENFSYPDEFKNVPDSLNPYSPLGNFTIIWLDDILVATTTCGNREEDFKFHSYILARVVDKLNYYDFRISLKKSSFFQSSINILGYTLEAGRAIPDEKRKKDILVAPFPDSRNKLLGFNSLCGTLRHCMSLKSHEHLAKLYDLTSVNKPYNPTKEHFEAFRALKLELTNEPLFTYLPNPEKAKILYCDASKSLLGGVLLEVDFPSPFVRQDEVPKIEGKPFSIYDALGRKIYKYLSKQEIQMGNFIPGDGNCFIHSILDQIKIYGLQHKYPDNVMDFRVLVCTYLRKNTKFRDDTRDILQVIYPGKTWNSFVQYLETPNEPTDLANVFVKATADLTGRNIVIITSDPTQKDPLVISSSSSSASSLPPFFLGFKTATTDNGVGHYLSLVVTQPNVLTQTPFTSFSPERTVNDMSQDEIFSEVKKLWGKTAISKPPVKVLQYLTRSLDKASQNEPIYLLELRSLLQCLHTFRHLIVDAPVVVVVLDSRALWCLLHRTISETALKVGRWAVSIRMKYQNLMFFLVPSGDNISDYLSRSFTPTDFNPNKLVFTKNLPQDIVELQTGTPLTMQEATEITNGANQYLETAVKPKGNKKGVGQVNAISLSNLSETLLPLQQIREKLNPLSLIKRQKEELSTELNTALTVPVEKQSGSLKFTLQNGVLSVVSEKFTVPLIFIPPSLEGLLISYYHLLSAHRLGRTGLYWTIQELYYFPNLRQKCIDFASLCLNCNLVHGIKGRKATLGQTHLPSKPFEAIYLDIVNLDAMASKNISSFLVIVCGFSKFVSVFPCKKVNDQTIIKHLQNYFSIIGTTTEYIIADNATIFRSINFLKFCSVLSIKVTKSAAYRSQARGQVEVFNLLLKKALSAILLSKKDYKFQDLLFIVVNMMNNSKHLHTKHSAAQAVFGRNTMGNEGFGINLHAPVLSGSLIGSSLATDIKRLRYSLDVIWENVKSNIIKMREKQELKFNKTARDSDFAVGEIVFLKDKRLPKPGTSKALHPPLQPSPFIISKVGSKVLDVTRIVDRFTTRVHKNFVKKVSDMDKTNPLFLSLPPSVQSEMGRPLTLSEIQQLAEADDLPLILKDTIGAYHDESGSGVETRAARRKKEMERLELEQAFAGDTDNTDWSFLDEDEGDDDDLPTKSVHFDT